LTLTNSTSKNSPAAGFEKPDSMSVPEQKPEQQPEPEPEHIVPMRLQRFLARAGVASRRGSENLMSAGRVTVNGEVVCALGSKVDPLIDTVAVDGKPVAYPSAPVTLMLNKPAGYITTMSDPQGRACVAALVPTEEYPGLFPVGRLDGDTTGLLLFSTDGDLAHQLLHPRHHVQKTYEAEVAGIPSERSLERLSQGIELEDGMTSPAKVEVLSCARGRAKIRISIHEGRKRQVRRMFEAIDHPVYALHRASFAHLTLGDLEEGSWRLLTESETEFLRSLT